jgi:hypothetical protein
MRRTKDKGSKYFARRTSRFHHFRSCAQDLFAIA